MSGRLIRAAHSRLDRIAGRAPESDDRGMALLFVMMVTTVIIMAIGGTLAVTIPNITSAKRDQDGAAALQAAKAGIEDVVAYLTSVNNCRSTTKVCAEALGASSTALHRTPLSGTGQSVTWTTSTQLTAEGYVRARAVGTAGNTTRTLIGDISLAPSILSFGYYTDYESQSPTYLYRYFAGRDIALTNSGTYTKINALDSRNNTITVNAATTAHWSGPATSGTNPNPASICGQHWYYDSASSPGRYTFGTNSLWGEPGSINSSSLVRTSSCDVVFTTGMTLDGPVYTRDALYISDATVGGAGPTFKQPVSTLWGFTGYGTPAVGASPWRMDPNAGGAIAATSQRPTIATFDLTLPTNIGTTGLPDNECVYTGPTRVRLNGDGTATITSPNTTTRNAASDPNCYPTGSLAAGVVNFAVNYRTVGGGSIYVQNLGTKPAAGWPATGTKSTIPASSSNSVMYLPAAGGATSPDVANSSAAPSAACSSTVKYSAAASATCAFTNVATTTDATLTTGWSAYTNGATTGKCNNTFAATDRELFECEYSHTTTAVLPPSNQYGTVRAAIQSDLASGTCLTGTSAAQATCLAGRVNARLQTANTGGHVAGYSTPANGDHQYLVTATAVGSPSTGAAQAAGSAPTLPMGSDPMFAGTATAAQEAATTTPVTLTVSRQTYGCVNGSGTIIGNIITLISGLLGCLTGNPGWGNTIPQFTLTSTQSVWAITQAASGASYFPNTQDVTQYSTGTSGAISANAPGDLYVEGNNQGKLSLIAQNDLIVTDDIKDTSSDTTADAVDLVAGQNVRNYHPVSCVDQVAADINATSAGSCPNDITGLYRGAGLETNGVLSSAHPAMQYTNMTSPNSCTASSIGCTQIDAAVFALSGSFLTDNYNRGNPLGLMTVNGGLYQSHRGANGVQWEFVTTDTKRATSGYSLQYHYVDLQRSGLPYAPPATGGSNSRIWNIVSVSSGS